MMDSGVSVRCCIAGGGPAGMMLGFLLARAGISVLVLEKHADFLRDFRGDTMHPSTLATSSCGVRIRKSERCGGRSETSLSK
jgi:flavin-dependent dehydrogenase